MLKGHSPGSAVPRGRVSAYIAITKPRIIELLLVTAVPTLFLAADGFPPWLTAIGVLIGGALAAAGANTLNSVYDADIDAQMERTQHRPVASGQISRRAGTVFGLLLSALSIVILLVTTNVLAALLGVLAIAFYAVGYTVLLKRRTAQNIVWGGAAGCMPVLIAWSAVTGSLTWTPIVMFLIVFWWTPPHYWPLAIRYRDDYENANVPMLPVVAPSVNVGRQIIAYSYVMVATSLVLSPVASMSWLYTITAIILGAIFLWLAHALARRLKTNSTDIRPMTLFHYSITYLALLFAAIAIDPFMPF